MSGGGPEYSSPAGFSSSSETVATVHRWQVDEVEVLGPACEVHCSADFPAWCFVFLASQAGWPDDLQAII